MFENVFPVMQYMHKVLGSNWENCAQNPVCRPFLYEWTDNELVYSLYLISELWLPGDHL